MNTVIFDLFETLVTEWGKKKYTQREIASDLNVDYQLFHQEWRLLQKDRYLGKISSNIEVLDIILRKLKVNYNINVVNEISQKRDECKNSCFEIINPQIIEMLKILKNKKYKIGLISNCSLEEITGLKNCELYQYFDAVVLSCDVGLIKPDIEIYRYCSNTLNVQPNNCYFVGDGGSDELNGAKKAGMIPLKALWFIKHFVKNYDFEKEYLSFMEPSEMINYINKNSA